MAEVTITSYIILGLATFMLLNSLRLPYMPNAGLLRLYRTEWDRTALGL